MNNLVNNFLNEVSITSTRIKLYESLAEELKKHDYSVKELSDISGLSKKTIIKILKMKNGVSISEYSELLTSLNKNKKVTAVFKEDTIVPA